jgi:Na+/H+-dicarboxylate symporter
MIDTNQPWYRRLHWQIFVAMGFGAVAGLVGGPELVPKVGWLGTLFVRLLRMVMVPLVFFSLVSGVASVGAGRDLGRLFSKTLGYYVLSSVLAAIVGLAAFNLVRPGESASITGAERQEVPVLETPGTPVELLLDIVPVNFIRAAAESDMLAVIFFSVVLGLSIGGVKEQHRTPLLSLFDAGSETMIRLTGGVIRFAPIGVFGLIARLVGATGFDSFRALGLYAVTLTLGLSVHMFVTLPLLLILLGRIKPSIHFRNMIEPMVMAFSTSSSSATLPVTLHAVKTKVGVSNRLSSFVLPLGATVNMDGTALYECAGALFIAQVMGVDLGLWQQLIIVVTALLVSVGAAAVPSAGLVMIFIVTDAIGLRGPEVEVIVGAMLAIDRPLDMYRTAINIFGDSCGAAIIARSEGETEVDRAVA